MITPSSLSARTILALLALGAAHTFGADPAEIEVQVRQQTLRGKVLAHDDEAFWLMGRDGRLEKLPIGDVGEFRQVSSRFQAYSAAELRDQLRREMGNEYEIVGTGHYLVCAAKGEAQKYAGLFEDLYRTLYVYCRARNFRVTEPEFPLVALVFPDHARFAAYARQDGVQAMRGLRGYYLVSSNRIALFEDGSNRQAARPELPAGLSAASQFAAGEPPTFSSVLRRSSRPGYFPEVDGEVQDTIVHEATHQVAFNVGLHTRVGRNPKWVVEGFATMFEPEGMRSPSAGRTLMSRANRERFIWFGNFAKSRRKANSLEEFVAGDEAFGANVLDGYSQAWALTFFLVETRNSQYAQFLSAIMQRDPLAAYDSEQRVADFKRAFGSDLKLLEADFLRFMAGIR
jgi:hypothetical protein